MKKLMMLGAGSCQLSAIKRIKELGYTVVVSDNRLDSPGKEIGDVSVLADTFSFEETLRLARDLTIDGIMTSGTDQAVLTVNQVAKALALPQLISKTVARHVTDKAYMKKIFKDHHLPTADFALIQEDFRDSDLIHIKPPYVIKPLDSQGQRGIFKVDTVGAIRSHFQRVVAYSRQETILVESYYENTEVTVSGWVESGTVHILTVTDRVTFNSDAYIGVCTAHEYPSRHLPQYGQRIMDLTHDICKVFSISAGPIYFQFLVGREGVLVNEIACRIGGAYEDIFIPFLTGVSILDLRILAAIAPKSEAMLRAKASLNTFRFNGSGPRLSVQLFFCKPGVISEMTPLEELLQQPYILSAGYNIHQGQSLVTVENASQRAGYFIVTGQTERDLQENLEKAYERLQVKDTKGNNLVLKQERLYR